MGNKKVIIIGAGITGLSAGCYLQMNNYDTEIFELHNLPGGLCTSWKRNGYTFDGCIHWLCGSKPNIELYTIWEELGAIQDKEIVDHEIFMYNDLGDGKNFSVYCDSASLEKEMLKYAPEDESLIKEFIKGINTFKKIDMPVLKPQELMNSLDKVKFIFKSFSALGILQKYNKMSIGQFQKLFKSAFFNQNFASLFGMYEEMPVTALLYTLALLDIKSAGYPVGGSLEFAKSIEKRYISLGGKLHYNSKVEKIIIKDNSAAGVKLSDGSEHFSDLVISAADGHFTVYNMLEGKYVNDEIEGYYKNFKLFPPIIQTSFGIAKELKNIPDAVTSKYKLQTPIYIDPKNTLDELGLKVYNFDPTLAPKGKTTVVSFFQADYDYWTNLKYENLEKYKSEKYRVAQSIIEAMDEIYGDIKPHVEVYDVATPDTYVRYTNNWLGSFEGFIPTVDNALHRLKIELPGLNNFYMIGQWVQPGGGLPTGGMHGRYIAQILCKKDGKKFTTIK